MAEKILVAVDDSENAERAVNFLANNFVRELEVTLISVCPDTATLCAMDSPGLVPYFKSRQSDFCVLEDEKKKLVKEALDGARSHLIQKGFSSEKITVKLLTKNEGIARDIVSEAEKGYDLIILGRKGLSGIKDFFLGSVTQKVINRAKDISVLVVH